MADLELKRKTKTVNIYGKDYEIKFPTFSRVQKYLKDMKSEEYKDRDLDLAQDFMSDLGLPKDISGDMEIDDFKSLVQYIVEAIKKN